MREYDDEHPDYQEWQDEAREAAYNLARFYRDTFFPMPYDDEPEWPRIDEEED